MASTTLFDIIRRIRSQLSEKTPHLFADYELTDWVNDACRDQSRRAEDLQNFSAQIGAIPAQAKYVMPLDMTRVHRVEYVPTGSTLTYPVYHSTYEEMDQIWGINQLIQSSYPSYYVLWGTPNGVGDNQLQMQFFPVPSASGIFNIFYFRLPYRFDANNVLANPNTNWVSSPSTLSSGASAEYSKTLDIVEGWDDLIKDYVVYKALMKDRSPEWQMYRDQYELNMEHMIDVTRQWHDQQRMIMTSSRVNQPQWLYEFE